MDPLGMTGSLCGSLCEPTGLSQYPVFKVQTAADSLHILRFYPPRATDSCSAARRYITHSRLCVSTGFSEVFSSFRSGLPAMAIRERKAPPEPSREASRAQRAASDRGFVIYRFVSQRHSFSTHAPVSRNNLRCGGVMYQPPSAYARAFLEGFSVDTQIRRAHDALATAVRRSAATLLRWRRAGRSAACPPGALDPQPARARTYMREARAARRRSCTPPWSIMRRPSERGAHEPQLLHQTREVDLVLEARPRPPGRPRASHARLNTRSNAASAAAAASGVVVERRRSRAPADAWRRWGAAAGGEPASMASTSSTASGVQSRKYFTISSSGIDMTLPNISSADVGQPDVVAVALAHLLDPVGALEQRQGQATCGSMPDFSMSSRPASRLKSWSVPADLDVGLDGHRVVRLRDRIEELVQRDGLLRSRSASRSRRARVCARR